jgi:N-acetyl-gamma-glutamyl-phosphate/LysW-gamma-L-alpha-aminoadipyl-6-phosphate reductase
MDVSVIGGSGYAGGELLRLLLQHPEVTVKQVLSRSCSGRPLSNLHPNLRGLTSLVFDRPEDLKPCDVLFLALPNGESMKHVEEWMDKSGRIIDTGADFRLESAEDWEAWYGIPHLAPGLLGRFVYGLPEINRDEITGTHWVASPGCEAIVSILCLFPFLKREAIKAAPIIIDAKMSSSQAGRRASEASHHPERAGSVRSYMPVGHRHTAEIEQVCRRLHSDARVDISATAVEMVRGILVTIHTFLDGEFTEKDAWRLLRREYGEEPFIRFVKQRSGLYRYPEPKILQGTNFCEVGFAIDERSGRLVIIGAIDNLVKGTAGNAVQCMNLMCGFPETSGLEFPGLHPV